MGKKEQLTTQQMVQALLVFFRQDDLALLCDTSQATISRIKHGGTDGVDYRTVDAIRRLHKRYRGDINKLAGPG